MGHYESILYFSKKLKLFWSHFEEEGNGVFRPPPGSWQAPLGNQIDPRVSADAVNVRNDQQQCPRPQAVMDN